MQLLLTSTAAMSLVCSGTELGLSKGRTETVPFEISYRVDVDGSRWSVEPCDEVKKIRSRESALLILYEGSNPRLNMHARTTLDLISGAFEDRLLMGRYGFIRRGRCEEAAGKKL